MNTLIERYGRWVVNHPIVVLLASVVVTLMLASGAKNLSFTNDYRVFFSDQNPQLLAFEELQAAYTKSDNVLVMLRPKDGDVFTEETLNAVAELTERAWQVPYSIRVDSLTNYQHMVAEDDDLIVSDLVEEPSELNDAQLAYIKSTALAQPTLVKKLVSPDGSATGVNITMEMPPELSDEDRLLPAEERRLKDPQYALEIAVADARLMVEEIEANYPNIEFSTTGLVMMNQAFPEATIKDMSTIIPMAFGVIIVGILILIASPTAMIATVLVVLMSIVAAMGTAGWMGYKLTPPSASAPTLILTLAVADCVHFLVTLYHNLRNGMPKHDAVIESLRINAMPIFLTSATTAIGFLSMNASDAPPFRDLGNITAIGVFFAFFLSMTFLPAFSILFTEAGKSKATEGEQSKIDLATIFTNRFIMYVSVAVLFVAVIALIAPRSGPIDTADIMTKLIMLTVFAGVLRLLYLLVLPKINHVLGGIGKVQTDISSKLMNGLADFVIRQRTALLVGMGAIIIGLTLFAPKNELNDVFVEYFDETVPFRVETDKITESLSGLYLVDYSIDSGEEGGVSNPEFLAQVEKFERYLESRPEVQHVSAITETVRRLNRSMHGDDQAYYQLPESRELSAQYLLLYEMSLPYGLDLNNQINFDKSTTRMSVTLETLSTVDMLKFEDEVKIWMDENTPAISTLGTGPTAMFSHIGMRNIISMLSGTSIALVLISLILVFALRSLKFGLISLIPNLAPALMSFGIWALLVGQVGLAVSIVVAMTLGIVVDDTIHFLSKYIRARREQNLSAEEAVRYAFNTVGVALVVTTIVLVGGFLVISQSNFLVNSEMGLLTAITIAIALIVDFLFLPPLLLLLDGDKSDAKNTAASSQTLQTKS